MIENKFCVNCEHCWYSYCLRNCKDIDLVSGRIVADNKLDCSTERNGIFYDRIFKIDRCGKDGKYFKPKQNPKCPPHNRRILVESEKPSEKVRFYKNV